MLHRYLPRSFSASLTVLALLVAFPVRAIAQNGPAYGGAGGSAAAPYTQPGYGQPGFAQPQAASPPPSYTPGYGGYGANASGVGPSSPSATPRNSVKPLAPLTLGVGVACGGSWRDASWYFGYCPTVRYFVKRPQFIGFGLDPSVVRFDGPYLSAISLGLSPSVFFHTHNLFASVGANLLFPVENHAIAPDALIFAHAGLGTNIALGYRSTHDVSMIVETRFFLGGGVGGDDSRESTKFRSFGGGIELRLGFVQLHLL